MYRNDRRYLSRFELDPKPFSEDDTLEHIGDNEGLYPDDFLEEDDTFWVDDKWDE